MKTNILNWQITFMLFPINNIKSNDSFKGCAKDATLKYNFPSHGISNITVRLLLRQAAFN